MIENIEDIGEMINVWIKHHGSLDLDTDDQTIIDFYNQNKEDPDLKNGIPTIKYYALLEWKDVNMDEWLYFASHNGVEKLCDCNVEQLNILMQHLETYYLSNYLNQNKK